jgi:threonine/homoserine/homoserine lactone efflux protein
MAELLALAGLGGPQDLLLFMAAVLVLNATPGVDLLLTVTRTLQGGARAGMAAALGINAGCVLHALAAAFGLATLLAVSATAFAFVKWAGAAYLLWLAFGMLREAWAGRAPASAAGHAAPRPWRADIRTGLLTNVLNPKVLLFFLAFLPQFIRPDATHKTLAFLLLGAVFVVQSTLFLAGVVALAARARRVQTPPALARALQTMGGALFAALALRLAFAPHGKA